MIHNRTPQTTSRPGHLDSALIQRAEALIGQLLPQEATYSCELRELPQTKEKSLLLDVACNPHFGVPEKLLKQAAQSLALQLGVQVEIPIEGHSAQHLQAESNLATTSLQGSPRCMANPTVFVAVVAGPIANVYEQVPSDIISRLFVRSQAGALLNTIENSSLESIRTTLREKLGPNCFKVSERAGFIHVALTEDPAILVEDEFYHLTSLLAERAPSGKGILLTLVPLIQATPALNNTQVLQAPHETESVAPSNAPNPRDHRMDRINEDLKVVQETLLTSLGTRHPVSVAYNEEHQRIEVHVLTGNLRSPGLKDIVSKVEATLAGLPIPLVVTKKLLSGNSLIDSPGKRPKISLEDIEQLARVSLKRLAISQETPWAQIRLCGNCIVLQPQLTITPLLLQSIRERLSLIPAPIIIDQPSSPASFVPKNALVSMVKLMLPPSASLVRAVGDRGNNFITLTIRCAPREWDLLKPHLTMLSRSVVPDYQRIHFEPKIIEQRVADSLGAISSRHRKVIAKQMLASGAIPISRWKSIQRQPQINPDEIVTQLRASQTAFKDWTHKRCFSLDPLGASLLEDCLSVELNDSLKTVTVGIHMVCAPAMIPSFSHQRFMAYDRGNSIYNKRRRSSVSKMLPELDKYGYVANASRPSISLTFSIPIKSLSDPNAVMKSIAQGELDLTIIRNRYPLAYYSGADHETLVNDSEEQSIAISLISQLTQTLRRANSLEYVRPFELHTLGVASGVGVLLRIANNRMAEEIHKAKLPCIFQNFSKPSRNEIEALQSAIALVGDRVPQLVPFIHMSADEILHNDQALRSLLSSLLSIDPNIAAVIKPLRRSEILSLTPQPSEAIPTLPLRVKGAPLRNLAAFVAQHQFLAARGVLVEPLSAGEVGLLYKTVQKHDNEIQKVGSELELFEELKILGTLSGTLHAQVAYRHKDALPILKLPHGLAIESRCVLDKTPSRLKEEGYDIRPGDTITVVPSHYQMAQGRFVFKLCTPESGGKE